MPYAIALVSLMLCLGATPLVRHVAVRRGWLAQPVKDRWHQRPTALMGGIAIYISVAAPLVFLADFSDLGRHLSPNLAAELPQPPFAAALWIGITALFIVGLVDDFISIKPHTKLVGQIMTASLMTFLGFQLHWFTSLTLDTIVTIVWIVGITNAFNLIDNMDGLCAGTALVAGIYFGWLLPGDNALPAWLMAGAAAGFLCFNFNPARIFMGDCGSLVIGFTMAMLGLEYTATGKGSTLAVYAVPVMVLMVPILDTTLVTLIRLLSGRKASTGGRDHTSHRLVLMGFNERQAVLFLYGVGAISGIAALFVHTQDTITSPAVIIPLLISVLLIGIYMAQIRVYPEKEYCVLKDHAYTPILMELTYKRQIGLVLLDFCLIAFSYYLSYRLRFNSEDFVYYFRVFLHSLPAIIACKFTAFFIIGVYRGLWRFMSTDTVFVYLKASAVATLLSVAAVTYLYRFKDFSKGIFLIDWLLTTGLMLGSRGSFRIAMDAMNRKTMAGEKVLIYGAGRGGEILLRELINNKRHRLNPVGFIDDDVLKIGKKLQGYPILGTFREMDALREKHRFNGVLISFNGHDSNNLEGAKAYCEAKGLFLKRFSITLESVPMKWATPPPECDE